MPRIIALSTLVGEYWRHLPHIHYIYIYIYMSVNLLSIGSDNGMSPVRRQAITWTNATTLSNGPLGTHFIEIRITIQNVSFKKMHLKMSSETAAIFSKGRGISAHPTKFAYWFVSLRFGLVSVSFTHIIYFMVTPLPTGQCTWSSSIWFIPKLWLNVGHEPITQSYSNCNMASESKVVWVVLALSYMRCVCEIGHTFS